jgi:sigma-E factor negative regulatory protein RseA
MEENLSALVDGELNADALSGFVVRVGLDQGLARRWADYHLIGDVLRGTVVRPFEIERFRAALAKEPTVYAPGAAGRWTPSVPLRRTLSFAAAAAAIVFVGWMAWPMVQGGPIQHLAAGAKIEQVQPVAQAAAIPSARGVEDYLLAHQRFSPSFAIQGAAPYVRLVGDASKGQQ